MMPTIAVRRAATWEEIERVASEDDINRCIQPGKGSWGPAKTTWENYGVGDNPNVIYFIILMKQQIQESPSNRVIGYIRLHKASSTPHLRSTWVVDYVWPIRYTPVVLAAQQMPGTVLVSIFSAEDDICTRWWPKITAAFPLLGEYPYRQKSPQEKEYFVVPTHP